jgi:hypothetical protein
MKVNIFAQMMAFMLTWALFITALPSSKFATCFDSNCKSNLIDAGGVSGISPRVDPASVLLGINCRGSSECGGYCHPNVGNIKYFVDQLGKFTRCQHLRNRRRLYALHEPPLQSLLDTFH